MRALHLHCIFLLCVIYYPIIVPGAPCTCHSLDRWEHAQFRRIVHFCTSQRQWIGSSVLLNAGTISRMYCSKSNITLNGWFSHLLIIGGHVMCRACVIRVTDVRGQSSLCVLRDYLPTRSTCLQNIIVIACMRSTVLRWAAVRIDWMRAIWRMLFESGHKKLFLYHLYLA